MKRRPRLAIGLPVLAAGIAMIAVASTYLGPLVPNAMPPPCFPESCPDIGYFAIIGVAGFFLVILGAIETLFGLLVRAGVAQPRDGSLVLGLTEEDQKILSLAREIHARTKFPKRTDLQGVGWREGQPWYWCFYKHRGMSKSTTMVLAAGLRGRLLETDWRILLSYYFQRPRLRFMLRWFVPYMLFILLLPLGGIMVVTLYGIQASRLYGQFVVAPLALLGLLYVFSRTKGVALKQDRWVATSIGREALEEVFKKIDGLQLPEIENAKRRRGLVAKFWPMPNITERIQNLSENHPTVEGTV